MTTKPTLNALQALRGFAALLVVADHAIDNIASKGGATVGPALSALGYSLGSLGVAVFFVISGFVMMYAHGNDFGVPGKPLWFANRRIGRIVPIYWLVTLVYAVYLAAGHRAPELLDVVRSFLFVPYASAKVPYGYPILGQGWTLNYEAFFYLVFGLSLFLKRGIFLVVGFFAVLALLGALGIVHGANPLAFWAAPIVLFFLAGIGLAMLRSHRELPIDFAAASGLAALSVGAAVFADVALGNANLGAVAVSALGAVAAAGFCALATETPGRDLGRKAARAMGDGTYAIYLTHTLLIGISAGFVGHHMRHLPLGAFVVAMLVLTTAFGLALHYSVERWLIRTWATIAWQGPRRPKAASANA